MNFDIYFTLDEIAKFKFHQVLDFSNFSITVYIKLFEKPKFIKLNSVYIVKDTQFDGCLFSHLRCCVPQNYPTGIKF